MAYSVNYVGTLLILGGSAAAVLLLAAVRGGVSAVADVLRGMF